MMAASRPSNNTTTVLVPLYYYPLTRSTWQPLYDAISSYPDLNFLVIVNPNSGPGDDALPGPDYVREVPRLNGFPNVQTIGYLKVDYCQRPMAESCQDVQKFADWNNSHDILGLYVEGIFVDETPNHYSEQRLTYLNELGNFIRGTEGLLGSRLVMHNPGTPPDASMGAAAELGSGGADVICTCEEPWSRFIGTEVQKRLGDYPYERSRSAFQISGIPPEEIDAAVEELSRRGCYIFATDLKDDFYESFSQASWKKFVAAMAAAGLEAAKRPAGGPQMGGDEIGAQHEVHEQAATGIEA